MTVGCILPFDPNGLNFSVWYQVGLEMFSYYLGIITLTSVMSERCVWIFSRIVTALSSIIHTTSDDSGRRERFPGGITSTVTACRHLVEWLLTTFQRRQTCGLAYHRMDCNLYCCFN